MVDKFGAGFRDRIRGEPNEVIQQKLLIANPAAQHFRNGRLLLRVGVGFTRKTRRDLRSRLANERSGSTIAETSSAIGADRSAERTAARRHRSNAKVFFGSDEPHEVVG